MAEPLDWANQPNPFRHYEGCPLVDLPAGAAPPAANMLALLRGELGTPANASDASQVLSALLFHSAAISATKLSPAGTRYALRVNPSSGNLHPTEFHFSTHGLAGWDDGIYHYRPSQHMAEQRAQGTPHREPLQFLLTTIAWREAWKYRQRAYRYCLLDAGHAIESLVLAGRALGWGYELRTAFEDEAVAAAYRLAEDEWPLALVTFEDVPSAGKRAPRKLHWTPGVPNVLSSSSIAYPEIEAVHRATQREEVEAPDCVPRPGVIQLPTAAESDADFAAVVRRRRSALDFVGGGRQMRLRQLAALLDAAMAGNLHIQLWLFVHRVENLAPGLYRLDAWTRTLAPVRIGDQRVMAAGLSLGQDLAGNSMVTLAMSANLSGGYRDVHLEAGRVGQRLYLAAEALRLQATGIGAFYDAAVKAQLELPPEGGDVLYHFAIGEAISDPRTSQQ